MGDLTVLLKEELLSLKHDIISCDVRQGLDVDDSVSKIDDLLSHKLATSPFEGLKTAHLQRKHFPEHFQLVVSDDVHSYILETPHHHHLSLLISLTLSLRPSLSLSTSHSLFPYFHTLSLGTGRKKT